MSLTQEALFRALSENYESIYVVDVDTSAYQRYYESDIYSSLCLRNNGSDFFHDLKKDIFTTIYWEDQEYVSNMLDKNALISGLKKNKFYSFVYRLMIDGKPLYHKLRATTELIDWRPHLLIGIRNIDAAFRQDKAQAEELSAMRSKEITHLEAILASAEGYLEVNISRNTIHEVSPYMLAKKSTADIRHDLDTGALSYTDFMTWNIDNVVIENKDKLSKISSRDYLMDCYNQNERRASASFSMKTGSGKVQPCKIVFYLYKEALSEDILSFCVLYDLTEQQRKEKELKDLEHELQMSRLRNFTSQMQPHFLYNTLGSIQEIILDDPIYASELIGDFTIHLRSCIRAMANDDPIPFEQELANIMAYVNIEKMRFGSKLNVQYDIQKKDFNILPLSVQPLVENAIRHGIYERGERGGTVIVRTTEKNDYITISVEDDGVGFNVDAYKYSMTAGLKDSTGLKNIIFRLEKVMSAVVDIKSRINKGTKVIISIPKENLV